MKPEGSRTRCHGRTKSGKPCRAASTDGGLCFFHAHPNKAVELGRLGGRKNRHAAAVSGDPLPSPDTAVAVRNNLARCAEEVYSGKLSPQVANTMASLLSVQLRVIQLADHEQRLAKLEKLMSETEAATASVSEGSPSAAEASGKSRMG